MKLKRIVISVLCASWASLAIAEAVDTRTIKEVVRDAEKGDVQSQAMAGYMYVSGDGVERNYREAYHWLMKATQKGNADAQHNLGVMYENGFLVELNYQTAAKWYRLAAEQDHADAITSLNSLYLKGRIPSDPKDSKKWFDKGIANHMQNPEALNTKLVTTAGTRVCNEADGSVNEYAGFVYQGQPQYRQVPGTVVVTGYSEGASAGKIQIRVASIVHRRRQAPGKETAVNEVTYNNALLRPNSVFWDDLRSWKPC
ncbi:tetratricopeptide repeat protein [Noviherbaspirillum malthae]|uniref:tetratricopeptide repeat protein n=1 Tax=Noviherbaspirillum malthae TaxID=1260987 RepID=UPI00188E171F|nr:tetratricopeptide repeat protein [Noviherbaspirillum malthae]